MINAEQQRDNLNQVGLEMLQLCISQVAKAKESFVTHDSDLAEEVMHTENRVNALDIKIEKDCEKFLALYNPVAIDLRFIMAIRKINFDLERIGDHAYGIANYVVEIDNPAVPKLLESVKFEAMFETITSMFENITEAYENRNLKMARKVFKKDKIVDKFNMKSFAIIEAEIKKNVSITSQALILFSVIKKMERIGDLLKNVAEELIFYIDAEIIKHKKKK